MSGQMPAARPTDPTTHGVPASPGTGAPTVLLDGLPAWRTMVDTHLCPAPPPPPHGPEKIYLGSTTVLINDQMACRMGDILQGLGPPNPVMMGSPTVLIGDVGFGMGRAEPKAAFVAAGLRLLEDWDNLDANERLIALERALNATRTPGMPPLEVQELVLPPGHSGQFNYEDWTVDLDSSVLEGEMDADRMGQLLNTTYHEARHAEQWWSAAQHRAANGESALDIALEMNVPTEVANDAVRYPAAAGTSEGAMGESVYTSVYGSRALYRNNVLNSIDAPDAYIQYLSLPEEQDAWRQGDDVEHLIRVAMR